MKTSIIVMATDNGDGSCSVSKFNTEAQAEAYRAADEAAYGNCTNPENVHRLELEFSPDGRLLNPDVFEEF